MGLPDHAEAAGAHALTSVDFLGNRPPGCVVNMSLGVAGHDAGGPIKEQVWAMQYSRRRIQRVSGVIVRDERIESRDFSVQPARRIWDGESDEGNDRTPPQRKARFSDQIGAAHRERT